MGFTLNTAAQATMEELLNLGLSEKLASKAIRLLQEGRVKELLNHSSQELLQVVGECETFIQEKKEALKSNSKYASLKDQMTAMRKDVDMEIEPHKVTKKLVATLLATPKAKGMFKK